MLQLLLILIPLFLFLDLTLFNTRGEPREAVVALSMLNEGNWILPVNNGVDLAYKPPFFHWLIALFSLPFGTVTELTARLPSALAAAVMTLAGFRFFRARRGTDVALVMAVVTVTNFEVHRAAVACRVDMLLACMMVLALYALYRWTERDMRGVPWAAVLCLSGAFLTKGPVGAALPCLVVWVFGLLRGRSWWRTLLAFMGVGVASCVLPALWYVAAWHTGGQAFLDLVYEENVLRLLGKMSYESHVNPWTYNVVTVLSGFVPYTLLGLLALFVVKYKRPAPVKTWWSRLKTRIREMDDARLFALVSTVLIFVFYCIPKSKRSVYLLPIYPFIAYFVAEFLIYMKNAHARTLRAYGHVLAALAVVLAVAFVAVRLGLVPESLFGGKHGASSLAMLRALRDEPLGVRGWLAFLVPLGAVVYYARSPRLLRGVLVLTVCIFVGLDGLYQPLVLNTKSDKPVADFIARLQPTGKVYSFRTDVTPGNPLHPFTINFYLGDRVEPFEAHRPAQGLLIVGNDEIQAFQQRYPGYAVRLVRDFGRKSCDDHKQIKLYHLQSLPQQPLPPAPPLREERGE